MQRTQRVTYEVLQQLRAGVRWRIYLALVTVTLLPLGVGLWQPVLIPLGGLVPCFCLAWTPRAMSFGRCPRCEQFFFRPDDQSEPDKFLEWRFRPTRLSWKHRAAMGIRDTCIHCGFRVVAGEEQGKAGGQNETGSHAVDTVPTDLNRGGPI